MAYETVWVAYERKPPHLPYCIRKTPQELADAVGVTLATVNSAWSKYRLGKRKWAKYAMVFIEKEENYEQE